MAQTGILRGEGIRLCPGKPEQIPRGEVIGSALGMLRNQGWMEHGLRRRRRGKWVQHAKWLNKAFPLTNQAGFGGHYLRSSGFICVLPGQSLRGRQGHKRDSIAVVGATLGCPIWLGPPDRHGKPRAEAR